MRCVRVLIAAFAAAFLAGCAAKPVPYDRTTSADIKTIGIVTPSYPEGPYVVLASSVGQSLGLIGALVDAGLQADRESRFKKAIAPHNFSVNDTCLSELKARLEEQGYTVLMVPQTRPKQDFLEKYPTDQEPKVDAYLDVVVNYGYISAGIGATPYRPTVFASARLVKASDSSVLMKDLVIYNPVGPYGVNQQAVTIPPDPAYSFPTIDKLVADPGTAVKGMQLALQESVKTVGQLLK
jgi:hypothetical protein